jgi:putative phage-type endonuclease
MTAVELLPPEQAVHGNDRWYQIRKAGVTASEIAIVLGISPYGSPFSLYWQKVNDWRDDGNAYTSAGRHLEGAIADWWAAEHPGRVVHPAGLYAHPERPWQLATPDRFVCDPQWHDNPFPDDPLYRYNHLWDSAIEALLECKWVAYSWDGWGEPGTDDIPVHYRAQALWQLDVLGVDEVHFAVLGPGGFRAYGPIRRDETDLAVMRKAGEEFIWRVRELVPPDLDSHTATLGALRRLHPSIGDGDVEIPVELAETYRKARADKAAAQARIDECEARIRAALGSTYARTTCGGRLVASRSVYERKPYEVGPTTIDKLNPGRADSYV